MFHLVRHKPVFSAWLAICLVVLLSHAAWCDGVGATRIICGSPALTEMIFALGCGDRVVGVSAYTTFPPEALEKPRIGGLFNPDRERLLGLQPDLILTQGGDQGLTQFAQKYQIDVFNVSLDTLSDVPVAVVELAVRLGVPREGNILKNEIEEKMARIQARVSGQPVHDVLLVFGRSTGTFRGLTTVGPGSFLNELLNLAGGRNIFQDARGAYPQVSKESLVMRKPEWIVELYPPPGPKRPDEVKKDWSVFKTLPAVTEGRIAVLSQDFLLVPGPRVGETLEVLARTIHPECFDE